MPKYKPNKSALKRIKVTGRGKLMRKHPGAGHLKSVKSSKRIRHFRKDVAVPAVFVKTVKRLMGIGN